MADMEVSAGAVSAASWEPSEYRGDGMDGRHAIMGGVGGESLPPRKRLLVGLRQNGWLPSSPPLVSRDVGGFSREVGHEEEDVAVDGEEGGVAVGGEQEEGRVASLESTGMRRIKHRGVNCSTEARVAVSASATVEFFNPSFKKPRMARERPKLEDTDRADASKREQYRQTRDGREGTCAPKSRILVPVRKGSQGMAIPLSSHDPVAAAKSAAAQAVKLAVAAKENAAAKAGAAVKAAAAAKVALEAAAHAARAVTQVQAGLQRKAAGSEPRWAGSPAKLQVIVQPGSHREKISPRAEVKVEEEDKQAGCGEAVSVDDEELVGELHRAINSSPQISHCLKSPVREVSFTAPAENSAELPFDAMVEADSVAAHTDSDIHDRRPDFLQEILEAAVLADSAMSLDEAADANVHEEVLESECDGGAGLQESHSFSDLQVETKEGESRSDARLFDEGPQILAIDVGESSAAVQHVEITIADTCLEASGASVMVNADDAVMASKDSNSDCEDMALEVSRAADIVDADDVAMALKNSGAAQMLPAADAGMHLKSFQSAEVVGLEDADIALKGAGTAEVVDADDADTVLKDSGIADMVQVDVPSRVTPVEGLAAGSEPLLAVQEDLVVKSSLEESALLDG